MSHPGLDFAVPIILRDWPGSAERNIWNGPGSEFDERRQRYQHHHDERPVEEREEIWAILQTLVADLFAILDQCRSAYPDHGAPPWLDRWRPGDAFSKESAAVETFRRLWGQLSECLTAAEGAAAALNESLSVMRHEWLPFLKTGDREDWEKHKNELVVALQTLDDLVMDLRRKEIVRIRHQREILQQIVLINEEAQRWGGIDLSPVLGKGSFRDTGSIVTTVDNVLTELRCVIVRLDTHGDVSLSYGSAQEAASLHSLEVTTAGIAGSREVLSQVVESIREVMPMLAKQCTDLVQSHEQHQSTPKTVRKTLSTQLTDGAVTNMAPVDAHFERWSFLWEANTTALNKLSGHARILRQQRFDGHGHQKMIRVVRDLFQSVGCCLDGIEFNLAAQFENLTVLIRELGFAGTDQHSRKILSRFITSLSGRKAFLVALSQDCSQLRDVFASWFAFVEPYVDVTSKISEV